MEVLRSPKAVGLQVAEGWRSPGRRERMYSGHRTIGLQVTTAWRSPGGHRMRAYMSPQGDLRYVSSNPKPRLGTRCSAHTPSLGLQAGRRKSGIETWTLGEIFSQNTAACKTTAKTGAFIVFTEVAETSFSVRQCNRSANTSTRKK